MYFDSILINYTIDGSLNAQRFALVFLLFAFLYLFARCGRYKTIKNQQPENKNHARKHKISDRQKHTHTHVYDTDKYLA